MDRRILLATALAASLALGCQHGRDAYTVEVFNAQNLILEDKIYQLNDRIDELEARLEARSDRAPQRLESTPSADDESTSPETPDTTPAEEEIPDLTPPDVEPGTPTEPDSLPDPADTGAGNSAIHHNASLVNEPQDHEVATIVVSPASRITSDGAVLVVEARNRDGQSVGVPAKIRFGVRDVETRQSHFGEWQFDAGAVSERLRLVNGRRAFVFEVQWSRPLDTDELEVLVVYENSDGQKLKVLAPLSTRSPHHVADRWTPRATSSPPPRDTATLPSPGPTVDDGPGVEVYR